ncbi:MAG: hypothetical protein ACE5E3_05020, partial [Mariprofundus sp.]
MGDHRNLHDINIQDKAENSSDFDSLQSQLDAFMAQEKAALAESANEDGSAELQERLDGFISNLQSQLDTFTAAQPTHSQHETSKNSMPEKNAVKESEATVEATEKTIPMPSKVQKVVSAPTIKTPHHSPSYSGL